MFYIDKNYVREAVNKLGGPTKTSNLLNVSNAAVHVWVKNRRVSNIDLASKLAELAKMDLEQVRSV